MRKTKNKNQASGLSPFQMRCPLAIAPVSRVGRFRLFLIATIGETESGDSFSGSHEIQDSLSRVDGERRERHDGGPQFRGRRL